MKGPGKYDGTQMTSERWRLLMETDKYNLTDAEIEDGWHWCDEFDGLLVGPHMYELNFCKCLDPHHKVYDTKPPEGGPTEIPDGLDTCN